MRRRAQRCRTGRRRPTPRATEASSPGGRGWLVLSVGAIALAAWSGYASGFPHSTVRAYVAWAVSCAGVVATDLILARAVAERPARPLPCVAPPPPASEKRRSRLGLFLPWIALVLVVAAWEALGIDTGEKVPHLTISALALAYRGVRAALFYVWVFVGLYAGVALAHRPAREVPADKGAGNASLVPFYALIALLLPHSRPEGVAFFVAVAVAALLIDLVARQSGRFASGEDVLRLLLGPPIARIACGAAWAYAGWHLFAH